MADNGTPVRARRRLRDRVPVRLRHHWRPVGALCAGLAVMVYAFGDARVSPYVTSSSRVEADVITDDVRGTVGLYDTSVPHSIQLGYDQTEFDKMMKEFQEDGNKEYIKADLTVDGVFLKDVGLRLKGNSTLMSLRGNGGRGMPGGGRNMPGDAGGTGATGAAQGAPAPQQQDGGAGDTAGDRGGRGGGMTQYDLSAAKPEELPWLIKVDEYIEGRAYQGEREISLRPGSNAQVPVNEALTLNLMDTSGLKNERYAFTSVKVNDRPEATRLMVENPDTEYADSAGDGNGVMYKARAGSSFAYAGDDPTDYEESFKQLNKVGSQDLEPVMKLIRWVDQASDEEFAEHLDEYVDVKSFATYVAAQNLLLNSDDMAGPGKNYLLWYDLDTKKFTVLGWDYNLTLSGDATTGPDDEFGMGGGMGGGMGAGAGAAQEDGRGAAGGDTRMPQGMPEGAPEGMPEGMPGGMPGGGAAQGQDGEGGADGGPGGGAGGGMGGHALKERFLASDAFDAVYKKAYRELYEKFYGSGTALKALDRVADEASAAGADSGDLDTAVGNLRKTVKERTTALAKNEEVTG
ncbi:CotH kinase family protein [Streptomyces sp. NPDC093065]|uniref:CotH kinase family protein n=1 Tax=Streptomyces sp. NPDC093065 TaxID=3366021 RepID=UPI00382A1498